VYRIDPNARVSANVLVLILAQTFVVPAMHLQQLLRDSVPFSTNLRALAQISQVTQHATITDLRSLACLVCLVLHVRADVFEDALKYVFVQFLGVVAAATDRHVWDLAG
jgi:hypothetical protein